MLDLKPQNHRSTRASTQLYANEYVTVRGLLFYIISANRIVWLSICSFILN